MKLCTIIGARPQFIKAAAFSKAIAESTSQVNECIIHTGQHYDSKMSNIFFEEMGIPAPKYMLDINQGSHSQMTGRMLPALEEKFIEEKPDIVVVYGDTNSTLAAALAASKLSIPIAHIESGLRSYNMNMPEEINRIVTDRMSTFLFCPTNNSARNLEEEGIPHVNIKNGINCQVHVTGDIMYDATKLFSQNTIETINTTLLSSKPNIFLTLHRQENVDSLKRIKSIIEAINIISESANIIFPVHPRTRNMLNKHKISCKANLIDPIGYLELLKTVKECDLVMTDSGGLQKEAFFLEKPCLILRDETEWIELIQSKTAVLVGADTEKILNAYEHRHKLSNDYSQKPFGDGKTAQYILSHLLKS